MKNFSKMSLLFTLSWSTLALSQGKEIPTQPISNDLPTQEIPVEVPEVETPKSEISTLTIDASDKTNFVFLGLEKGKLVPVTETDTWIFAVRRYIFKTQTGVNGTFEGGAAVAAGAGFEAFNTCEALTFEADQEVTMLGYTISANQLMTSEWFDYNEEGAVTPVDKFFAVSRDTDCLKVKILTYKTGVYEIEYSQVP